MDLTKDGFALYALPAREVTAPKIATQLGADGFYSATVDVNGMRGVPVQLQLVRGGEAALMSGASGEPIKLPIRGDDRGSVQITATELLSQQSASSTLRIAPAAPVAANGAASDGEVKKFFARRAPLTLALTPEQQNDPKIKALAARIAAASQKAGRKALMGEIKPNGVVLFPQPLKTSQSFPQWRTDETDLILLGSSGDNPLIFDQKRGHLLPDEENALHVTYSPFVGEYNALNVLAPDAAGLERLAAQIESTN